MNYPAIIEEIYKEVGALEEQGRPATYIPELAGVDPGNFGVHISTVDRLNFGIGDYRKPFSIQSIAKVLALVFVYRIKGADVWKRMGVEPSGTPFNSLIQLEADKGIPRNPLINAGAMVVCDMLLSLPGDPVNDFLAFVRELSNLPDLEYSKKIAESEKSAGYLNVALCNFIKSFGNIENETDRVLDFYFNLCSLEMDCQALSKTFRFLAHGGVTVRTGEEVMNASRTKRINALLQTCGFYDESGEFAFKVGLPGKSGVGGGIVAVHPGRYTISVWSPGLNYRGNSYKGMKFLELFTTKTQLSIF